MDKYILGQCLILMDNNESMFCEIMGYRGSGEYYVSLTRGVIDTSPSKFPPLSVLHESVIEELLVPYE